MTAKKDMSIIDQAKTDGRIEVREFRTRANATPEDKTASENLLTEHCSCAWLHRTCTCKPLCRHCGWGRHGSVHLPAYRDPTGGPYDHVFTP